MKYHGLPLKCAALSLFKVMWFTCHASRPDSCTPMWNECAYPRTWCRILSKQERSLWNNNSCVLSPTSVRSPVDLLCFLISQGLTEEPTETRNMTTQLHALRQANNSHMPLSQLLFPLLKCGMYQEMCYLIEDGTAFQSKPTHNCFQLHVLAKLCLLI